MEFISYPGNDLFYIQRVNPASRKKGHPIFLKGNEVVFGRSLDAQVPLLTPVISRRHAVLKKTGNCWSIQDEKSTNGVWVNNVKLKSLLAKELFVGDIFSLGDPTETQYIYMFCSTPDMKENSPPSSSPCKISKEDPVQAEQKAEMEERLQTLQRQLEEKQEAEKKLQSQLQAQEKEHQESLLQERERILAQKEESENLLKRELQEKFEMEEKKLREALQNHRQSLISEKERVEIELRQKLTQEMEESLRKEQHRLNQELESSALKAQVLEQQLVTSNFEHDQSRTNLLHHFGNLMETELTCSICVELFVQAYTLGCSHTFCRHCIAQWKRKKKECPICRNKIKSEARALVLDNFIERMVENLSPDMKARRMDLLRERGAAPSMSSGNPSTQADGVPPAATHPVQVPVLSTSAARRNPRHRNTAAQNIRLPSGNVQVLLRALPSHPDGTVRLVSVEGQPRLQLFQTNNQPRGARVSRHVNIPPPQVIVPTGARIMVPSFGPQGGTTAYAWAPAPGNNAQGLLIRGQRPNMAEGTIQRASSATLVPGSGIQIRPPGTSMATSSLLNEPAIGNDIMNIANEVTIDTVPDVEPVILQVSSSSNTSDNSNNSFPSATSNLGSAIDSSHTNSYNSTSTGSSNSASASSNSSSASLGSNRQATIIISDTESRLSEEEENSILHEDSHNSDEESHDSEEDSDDSDEEDYRPRRVGGAYYGGYGRCFKCGAQGHWAGGCRNR